MKLFCLPTNNFWVAHFIQKFKDISISLLRDNTTLSNFALIKYYHNIAKQGAFLLLLFLLFFIPGFSQEIKNDAEKELAYNKTINQRAEKIVATLAISYGEKAKRVASLVAGQYKDLNDIHTSRDTEIKSLKAQTGGNKEEINAGVKKVEDAANGRIEILHKKYLAALSNELTPQQVDLVKDGMTYDVVHVTYNGYNNMILNLTDEQKKQIMAWLIEAREHAMDAESSDKKHAWFGKYKGRINNYLSAAGYDLNKEGKEWEKRRNASKPAAKN